MDSAEAAFTFSMSGAFPLLLFWNVLGFLLSSLRTPVPGLYCFRDLLEFDSGEASVSSTEVVLASSATPHSTTSFGKMFGLDPKLHLVVVFERFPVVATSRIVVLYSFVLVLKVFNARLTLRTSEVAWYSLVFKNGIELLCDGIRHSAVSFLADGKLSLHNSSKYLVSASVQLEPQFLFVAPGRGFSSLVVFSLSLLGTELVEGDACGIGTWYGITAACP